MREVRKVEESIRMDGAREREWKKKSLLLVERERKFCMIVNETA